MMCNLHVVICCMALRSAHCGKTFLENAVAGVSAPTAYCSTSTVRRKDRCCHSKTRECLEEDGTKHSRTVPDVHGWPIPPYLSALTGAAGVIAVKRIFKQLTDGTLVLPEAPKISAEIPAIQWIRHQRSQPILHQQFTKAIDDTKEAYEKGTIHGGRKY
ncbi:hypothetical protein DFJ58DRAFT_844668 [Suillus subalutaceus]|uniref:uncharacterized protein n=1 Tax=Suillus subalutaceus TaxID=48586 RepID=UPI001B85E037|nr:uncharacterized protein DFJ58DRAFT_844668 [Suillus subalutaceus]KAG1842528.1 hypothetical protein DFJ58DRAFT_844668 [Suillus subalutaceus]